MNENEQQDKFLCIECGPDAGIYVFGHELDVKNNPGGSITLSYSDGEKADMRDIRPCPNCGMKRTKEGHDPCIGELPGVKNACCGHGTELGYVAFENGVTIRGFFTRIEKSEVPK
jgi:hypothetical protein